MNEILLEWAIMFVSVVAIVGALLITWFVDWKYNQDDDKP